MSLPTSTRPSRESAGGVKRAALSPSVAALLIVLFGCLAACGSPAADNGSTSVLVQIDSTTIAETDSLNIGRPVDIVVSRNGTAYVSDVAQSHVIAIDRAGTVVRVFGQKGRGPGEFISPSWLSLRGDTSLFVKDGGQMIVEAFDTRTGRYLSSQPLPKSSGRIRADGIKLEVAAFSAELQSNLAEVDENGIATTQGTIPEIGRKYPKLLGPFANQAFVRSDSTYYSISEFENAVSSWPIATRDVKHIEFPVRKRRGASEVDFETMVNEPAKAASIAYRHSIPMLLERDSRGFLIIAMYDVDRVGETFKGRFFISIIDVLGARACVDILLSAPDDPPARLAFARDTLISLVQEITPTGKPSTLLRRYTINTQQCPWLPIKIDGANR